MKVSPGVDFTRRLESERRNPAETGGGIWESFFPGGLTFKNVEERLA